MFDHKLLSKFETISMKQTIHTTAALLVLSLVFCISSVSFAATEAQEGKIKKIVMMMDIVAKEFAIGVAPEGNKIIVQAEYEESKVFLAQAFERYSSLAPALGNASATNSIEQKFSALTEDVNSKVEPARIRAAVSDINSQLLEITGTKIHSSPTTPVSLDNGKRIYLTNCQVCHGEAGKGDGPLAGQLNPAPSVLSNPEITGDESTTAYDNFQVINVGIANTPMPAWADILTEPEMWDVTYYIRSFSNESVKLPLVSAGLTSADSMGEPAKRTEKTIAEVRLLIDQSLRTFKDNRIEEAAEQAFDAYLAYENIESGLISKHRELGQRLESAFSRYRAEIKRGANLRHVEKIHTALHSDLDRALETLTQKVGFVGLFIQSLSIIVREGFEAILIIAALITFLIKSRNEDKLKSIYLGVSAGIIGSFITAYILHEILHISVSSQEVLEGWIMLLAVVVLFWVSYWLISKIEARRWQSYITRKMQAAVSTGSALTLGLVAFLAVYREGFETILFYKALYLYAGDTTGGIVPGFLLGCLILAVVYYLISKVGVRVPIKWFFTVTSVFLYYMAFTFMGKGLHELQMGQVIPMSPALFVPKIPWIGVYPTWETSIGQGVLALAYIFALIYTFGIKPEVESKQIQDETSHIQQDIAAVHNLVEHISHHAKRCEIFLKDTRDQDLKELSDHLKEIDTKVHELFDHVQHVENRVQDEYERLGHTKIIREESKGLS